MRVCHYIKPNARSESPTRAIWFKAWSYVKEKTYRETFYDFEFIRMVRGIKDTKTGNWSFDYVSVGSAVTFWHQIDIWTKAKTKTYLMSDEMSLQLPMLDVFRETCLQGWKLTLAVIPPAPTILRWKKASKSIVLLGASNIWQTPLPDICSGKTTCTHSKTLLETEPCAHVNVIDQWLDGLKSMTVEWFQFLKENDLGGFSPTAGSQSLRVWRHKFMTHRVLIDCHDNALALARESIYGARCEIVDKKSVSGKVYELDANGSYGGVMRDMRVPVKLASYRRSITLDNLRRLTMGCVCVARVSVDTCENVFPMRDGKRLVFAAGRFDTVLAGEELEYALKVGCIVDVKDCAIYACEPAFASYMAALWNMRQYSAALGRKADAEKYKLLNSSFYGRWAQHGRVWEQVGKTESTAIRSWVDIDVSTQEIKEYRQFGGIIQRLADDTESRESHPAIASCVLAGARMQLWRWMNAAGMENVFYCDTDSLFVNEVGKQRLGSEIQPLVLGKLKIKGEYDGATFYAQKYIAVGGSVRHAGVSAFWVRDSTGNLDTSQNQHVSTWIMQGKDPQAATRQGKRKVDLLAN